MFIIKLGEEALNKLEKQLTENCSQYLKIKKNAIENNVNLFEFTQESSILYNLLSCQESSSAMPRSLLFPGYSRFENDFPSRANTVSYSNQSHNDNFTISPRPYSAPLIFSHFSNQNIRKRNQTNIALDDCDQNKIQVYNRNCKIHSKGPSSPIIGSPSISCSTDSFCDEPMDLSRAKDMLYKSVGKKSLVDSWLLEIVFLITTTNKQYNTNLAELPTKIRLHLLQSSWHRIFITYLFEYLNSKSTNFFVELWKMVQSVIGTTNQSLSKKNMTVLLKNLIDELNVILIQIQNLNLDNVSMNYLRIGFFLTGNHNENNGKNLGLVELFIKSKLEGTDLRLITNLLENILKLNPVVIETVFYGHLDDSIESIIEQFFINS